MSSYPPSPLALSCAVIDDTIGPYALECRDSFDFTLLFEEAILCIVPFVILLLITPLRLLHLHRERSKVVESRLLLFKLVRQLLVFPHHLVKSWSRFYVVACTDSLVRTLRSLSYSSLSCSWCSWFSGHGRRHTKLEHLYPRLWYLS